MRRIVLATGTTLTGVALLLSYSASVSRSAATSIVSGSTTASAASVDTGASTTQTYDGAAASTRFGNVQVRITVTDGVLTAAEAIDYPDSDGHDQQINSYAIPILNAEAVDAGTASIDMVSGATYTSNGYVQSLQDALDQAGL
ncbi:FMN-binding protein [Pengzhenrongella frigida]|uniref:FMN-binding protein n=1 Tax=Pengzhenrongella frigida TaxID=1259133 RepID=A0A4Q5MYS1_9MICO|nr:FMN-binding protein [Cellulomonas sp. HLT2-17]